MFKNLKWHLCIVIEFKSGRNFRSRYSGGIANCGWELTHVFSFYSKNKYMIHLTCLIKFQKIVNITCLLYCIDFHYLFCTLWCGCGKKYLPTYQILYTNYLNTKKVITRYYSIWLFSGFFNNEIYEYNICIGSINNRRI